MAEFVREARGERGVVRAGYQVAAELGPWVVKLARVYPRQYTVEAVVTARSAYWSTWQSLRIELETTSGVWEWAVEPEWDHAKRIVRATVAVRPVVVTGVV